MAVTLLFLRQPAVIDSVTLDASLSEVHSGKVTVTQHPVEQGAKITDHKIREPDGLIIEGMVSNDPSPDPAAPATQSTYVTPSGGVLNYTARSQFDPTRAGNAYQALLALLDSPNLISVNTAIRSYDNMVMTELSVPRDASSGQALKFTATFTQVRIVQNQTVVVQAKTMRASPNQNLHHKVSATAADPQKKRSMLKSLKDSGFAQDPIGSITGAWNSVFGTPGGTPPTTMGY